MTKSSTKELFTPLDNSKRVFCSKNRLFETPGLIESNLPEFDLFFDIVERLEEEAIEVMTETMEKYMSKTRRDYGPGVTRPKIDDANEYVEKVLEIVDLFYIQNITQDQIMLRVFPVSLTGAASRWLRNEPAGSILTVEVLKTKFLSKYCLPARTAKKIEEINNFKQEPNESLF
nr:hypothetical protein [Tanacetum cinerariifolium]